jgi:NAD(P)-dependent dehydrogenase (short-subunit alcohol dehydrogenase family)
LLPTHARSTPSVAGVLVPALVAVSCAAGGARAPSAQSQPTDTVLFVTDATRNPVSGAKVSWTRASPFYCQGLGRIISISSVNGRKGQVGQANYAAAKSGVLGFTKALAQEGASKGITANVIAPGYINTEMVAAVPKDVLEAKILPQIPVGRLGTAEEIARCVVFLAAEEAGFITGACIDANGGQYMA